MMMVIKGSQPVKKATLTPDKPSGTRLLIILKVVALYDRDTKEMIIYLKNTQTN